MNRGDILKLAMMLEHVNQRELADKIGINEVAMHRYLCGFRKINDDFFKKLADAIKEIGAEHRKDFEEVKYDMRKS